MTAHRAAIVRLRKSCAILYAYDCGSAVRLLCGAQAALLPAGDCTVLHCPAKRV